jgi:hypothetical protein
MKITKEIMKEFNKKYDELNKLQEVIDDNFKTIRARYDDRGAWVNDEDGKEIEVKEKNLWQEIYYLGNRDNRAADYMRKTYADLFVMKDKEERMIMEIKKFEMEKFGFDHKHLNLPNTIELIQALVKYELGK